MGISGLLPVLKSITESKTLDQYKGRTLAIDGYCWLHRAIYSCSQEICLGQETDKYVTYFMDRINALRHNGVTPYVVFDGGPLPMKKGTEEERRKARQKNRELGVRCFNNKQFSEARKYFVRAADVSPYMAHRVIQHLKAQHVLYVVAPYEADAQLAYLIKNGLADGVITEDSDCLPFGCHTVLFKMDRDNVAQEIQTANLKKNKGLSFHMFNEQMFLEMCIFSGCDYLPSIPGFGLKKAYAAMKQHGSFSKIIRALRLEGKVRVPATYDDDFKRALLTFHHQRVYCPKKQQLVPLTPIPERVLEADSELDFVGPMLANNVAKAIAEGDMDPITLKRFPEQQRPLCRKAAQPKAARNTFAAARKVVAPRPKEAITSFFHARESAAAASFNAPRSCPEPVKRNLPPSFMDKWTTRTNVQDSSSSSAASPLTSHFFGAKAKRMSPPDESSKKTASRNMDSLAVSASQDHSGVDVTRVISFDPLKETKDVRPAAQADAVLKENQEPNAQDTHQKSSPPVKETAFSRMMRAGSMLQQHKLKKRKTGSVFCVGASRPVSRIPLSARMEKYAFSSKPTVDDETSIVSDSQTDRTTAESPPESVDEPESEAAPSSNQDCSDSDDFAAAKMKELYTDTNICQEDNPTGAVPLPAVSFDRFRYSNKAQD